MYYIVYFPDKTFKLIDLNEFKDLKKKNKNKEVKCIIGRIDDNTYEEFLKLIGV